MKPRLEKTGAERRLVLVLQAAFGGAIVALMISVVAFLVVGIWVAIMDMLQ